ncbi:MAG: type I methionyl aminopeptidase [Minisyncoccia bacterium]|jgi:methionyl aminopeptidase
MIYIKSPEEIEVMAEGGRRLAAVLKKLVPSVRIGMTTKELDVLAFDFIKGEGCKPSFLNYRPAGAAKAYPATLCSSVNDVIVHGLPSDYVVCDGDLVKLDLGLVYKGFHLDAARTVSVGSVTPEAKRLIAATRKALDAGIKEAKPGHTLGDIGFAIQNIAQKAGYSVAQGLTGHGIGKSLHEDPAVFNFGRRGQGEEIEEGMVIAIEPMINAGTGAIKQLKDDSYATRDGSLSAHFENTVAITKDGPRVLTE